VAHDFNNLLAVVLGNLNLARKRLPPDRKLTQLIENSIQAAERGATLTKRMLAFARRQELIIGPVDVPELVRGMADLLQRSIGTTIAVNTQFPLRLSPALADPNQLELALLNLSVNARDAMPEAGTITIGAREKQVGDNEIGGLAPGRYVCLSVADTGEGMDARTLSRAAEPFFTTKGVGKGTGLGLSMVHGLAEQSGGRLILTSTVGQGTTAELWLPVAEASGTAKHDIESEPPRLALNSKSLTVLVVDDDPLVLMNTSAMLEDLGHEVIEATSGDQALRILHRSSRLDLVITDQMMPGMTGMQLIDEIDSSRPDLPVILASGYSDLPDVTRAGLLRLSKPFKQSDLARALVMSLRPEGGILPFRPKHG
jgi:CheY-like chemotaxis protein